MALRRGAKQSARSVYLGIFVMPEQDSSFVSTSAEKLSSSRNIKFCKGIKSLKLRAYERESNLRRAALC
ncbi:hypothetical protein PUN28_002121 [Cardiocondyla obscurior]|uniref:Uncharacterized protein n=1 Tax=Cardiocondyla obscurior TaxID=286306 RepID=A0AAW2GSP0_9HYME